MHNLSLLESNSNQLTIDNPLSFNFNDHTQPNFTAFSSIAETKSYTPITGCVLEHILTTSNLTSNEKLYYLLADSLSIISKNNGHSRSCALPSEDWADNLGFSRSLVFKIQQSLVKKGYFIINKAWDKIGRNKRNLIIPTLPASVFNYLNEKFPDKVGWHVAYNSLTECKRSYLDRTKLFIPLNYSLLKIITSSEELTQLQKVVWLDFYAKCYKSHLSSNKQSSFSFISSYEELIERYGCSKASLSKLLNSLENNNFLTKNRFFCKREHRLEDRQDRSLWQITLSIPACYNLELMNIKDRAGLSVDIKSDILQEVSSNVNIPPMFIHSHQELASTLLKHQQYSKKSYIDEVIEELPGQDDIFHTKENNVVVNADDGSDSNPTVNVLGIDAGSNTATGINIEVSTSKETAINIDQQIKDLGIENYKNKTPYILGLQGKISCGDPQVSKSRPLLNKDFILNNKDLKNLDSNSCFFKNVDKPELSLSEFYKNSLEEKEKQLRNRDKGIIQKVTIPKQKSNKTLLDHYPLSTEQVDRLNVLSGREFSVNFVNQLMMKLYLKSQSKVFVSKNHMISYMSKALRYEKHQAPMVNHETFKFTANQARAEIEEKVREKYLSEIEYSLDTGYQSQLRRKIAGLFEPKFAYKLLTESKFECLNELFIIKLPRYTSLTERQQEVLENTVFSVYGNIKINYEIGVNLWDS